MICPRCGLPLQPQTAVCPRCGTQVYMPYYQPESSTISILALVFAFFMPMVGLVLSIVGMVQSKEEKNKKRSTIALICSIVAPIVYIILYFGFVFGLLLYLGALGA